jgi:putative ABC transport system substrate-binding protein
MSVGPEIGGKFLELLKEAVPTVSRVAVLWNPLTPPHTGILKETEAAARALGLTLQPVSARRPDEIDGAFAAMSRARADGLIGLSDAMLDSSAPPGTDRSAGGERPPPGDVWHP